MRESQGSWRDEEGEKTGRRRSPRSRRASEIAAGVPGDNDEKRSTHQKQARVEAAEHTSLFFEKVARESAPHAPQAPLICFRAPDGGDPLEEKGRLSRLLLQRLF
jgi:hypothetical protein